MPYKKGKRTLVYNIGIFGWTCVNDFFFLNRITKLSNIPPPINLIIASSPWGPYFSQEIFDGWISCIFLVAWGFFHFSQLSSKLDRNLETLNFVIFHPKDVSRKHYFIPWKNIWNLRALRPGSYYKCNILSHKVAKSSFSLPIIMKNQINFLLPIILKNQILSLFL